MSQGFPTVPIFETQHPRMDQVKFVEYNFKIIEVIWSVKTDHITSIF